MSLLLEALKKAEKAKEEAQRRADTKAQPGTAAAPLSLQEDSPRQVGRTEARTATPAETNAEAKPVLTRAELPDISQPLEILSDDFGPRTPAGGAASRSSPLAGARPAATARAQGSAREAPARDAADADRSAARKVFQAKFREPNPRLPFYITMAALAVFAVGTIVYFWYQLRPPPSLVNLNPAQTAPRETIATAPTPAPAPAPSAVPAPPPSAAIPGLPAAPRTAGSATPAIPRATTPRIAPEPDPAPAPRVALSATVREVQPATPRPVPQVHPKVQSGYAAYAAGDLETARADYQEALRDDPTNRDALLGAAAVDVRSGRFEAAEATYLKLLRVDPRDPNAQAALIALRGARQDPLVTESRLKNLLAADPGAHVLNFALGNQLAAQNRWSEAQQEYFKAFAAEPDNPDFAYNLAVSLDHLRQPKLALEYYQRALALATKRGASFDLASAKSRAAQLGGQ